MTLVWHVSVNPTKVPPLGVNSTESSFDLSHLTSIKWTILVDPLIRLIARPNFKTELRKLNYKELGSINCPVWVTSFYRNIIITIAIKHVGCWTITDQFNFEKALQLITDHSSVVRNGWFYSTDPICKSWELKECLEITRSHLGVTRWAKPLRREESALL